MLLDGNIAITDPNRLQIAIINKHTATELWQCFLFYSYFVHCGEFVMKYRGFQKCCWSTLKQGTYPV